MKTFIKIFHILLLTVMLLPGALAQETQVYHKNFIGFTLSELPFMDFRLSYERRISPTHGFKLELGYKPAYTSMTDATNIDLGQTPTAWCYRNTANWYYVSVGYRYYFNHRKTFYVSPELFYKGLSADHIIYSYGVVNSDWSENAYEIRTMHADIAGLNLLIGHRSRIRFSDSFNAGFDIYTGITLREKFIHTTIYGSTIVGHYHDSGVGIVAIPYYDTPDDTHTNSLMLFLQFGVVLFFSWK